MGVIAQSDSTVSAGDVARIAPGVVSIAVPAGCHGLGVTYVYAFSTMEGLLLVDLGTDGDDEFHALELGLARLGLAWSSIAGVLLTHGHPDHCGLARRVRNASGAWIAMHCDDANALRQRHLDPVGFRQEHAEWARRAGLVDRGHAERIQCAADELMHGSLPIVPDIVLRDHIALPIAGSSLRLIPTPGHTPGHLCLHDTDRDLVCTGDHVLSSVVPSVALVPEGGKSPMATYLSSLIALQRFVGCHVAPGVAVTVLPAHDLPFGGLEERCVELAQIHEHRALAAERAVADGCCTVWEVVLATRRRFTWDDLTALQFRAVVGEVYAYLDLLVTRGALRMDPGETLTFRLATRSTT